MGDSPFSYARANLEGFVLEATKLFPNVTIFRDEMSLSVCVYLGGHLLGRITDEDIRDRQAVKKIRSWLDPYDTKTFTSLP